MAEESDLVSDSVVSAGGTESRLSAEGYGLEVQGYRHRRHGENHALVFLPRTTSYRIRLSNANDHVCMVTVEMDDLVIGTFLLHPFTKCDIERPTDRPLGFVFLQDTAPPTEDPTETRPGRRGRTSATPSTALSTGERDKGSKKHRQVEKSYIKAVFKPEAGGKIIQIDVSAEHLHTTQRLELLTSTMISDLFSEIYKDFGDWIMGSTCVMIHWTSAEYDSPVEDLLRPTVQTALRHFRRQDDPIRKISLLSIDNVEIHAARHTVVTYTVDTVPTFEKALETARDSLSLAAGDTDTTVYFMSTSGRFLCSSDWIKGITPLFEVMHRDEIISKPGTLVLRVGLDPPAQLTTIVARLLNHGAHELQVVPETTVRECRAQLEARGGPWGEDPRWLFGGTLLENGRNLGFYGIGSRTVVDVVPRLQDIGTFRSLEMRDPIAVDGDQPVNTAEMIRREEAKTKAAATDAKKKPNKKRSRRGGTTLRGRVRQQYVEVDPVAVDERFITKMSVNILLKDKEEEILAELKNPQSSKGKTCAII